MSTDEAGLGLREVGPGVLELTWPEGAVLSPDAVNRLVGRAFADGPVAACIATSSGSLRVHEMSSRSNEVVDGTTMSACLAIGVQYGSCTTMVSGRASARFSRPRS